MTLTGGRVLRDGVIAFGPDWMQENHASGEFIINEEILWVFTCTSCNWGTPERMFKTVLLGQKYLLSVVVHECMNLAYPHAYRKAIRR